MVISLARRHTLLGCETNAMITKAIEIKANGDQISDTPIGSKVGLEGGD